MAAAGVGCSRASWSWPARTPAGPVLSARRRPGAAPTQPAAVDAAAGGLRGRHAAEHVLPGAPADRVADFAANVAAFDPVGFRAMASSSAEADLRDVLAAVDVPTLLLYGDQDVRAPQEVAEALQVAIPGSRLVMMQGVGHASPVEAPDRFSAEVRSFLNEPS